MTWRFNAVPTFREKFYALPGNQKESVRWAWSVFKVDRFDPRLHIHRIHSSSAEYRRTIHAVEIERNLSTASFVQADQIITVDIGTHDIYEV